MLNETHQTGSAVLDERCITAPAAKVFNVLHPYISLGEFVEAGVRPRDPNKAVLFAEVDEKVDDYLHDSECDPTNPSLLGLDSVRDRYGNGDSDVLRLLGFYICNTPMSVAETMMDFAVKEGYVGVVPALEVAVTSQFNGHGKVLFPYSRGEAALKALRRLNTLESRAALERIGTVEIRNPWSAPQ